jgi:hypothetical protein
MIKFILNQLNLWFGTTFGWPKAVSFIKAAMITPLLVYKDNKQVSKQAEKLAKSKHYNSVASLIDLQEGRNYIVMGRTASKLHKDCEKNIILTLNEDITPIIIIRNDWAVRNKWKQTIPSIGGPAPANMGDFYNNSILESEKKFLNCLKKYFPYIHIQLNIEPGTSAAANFSLQLAGHLRNIGFKNKLIINPYSATNASEAIRSQLNSLGVVWARSYHKNNPPPDPIWNTDGNVSINGANVKNWLNTIESSGKEYILWTKSLADCPNGIPSEYL